MGTLAQWLTFIALIAGYVYQYLNAQRKRRWDIEDRAFANQQVAAVATKIDSRAGELDSKLNAIHEDVNGKVAQLIAATTQGSIDKGHREGVEQERTEERARKVEATIPGTNEQ